jgi:hypothetical protein
MMELPEDGRRWRVTLLYEEGPQAGEREQRLMQHDPRSFFSVKLGDRDAHGRRWAYIVSMREIDSLEGTALIRLRWQMLG